MTENRIDLRSVLAGACTFMCAGALAQPAAPVPSASAAAANDRAQKEGDRPLYWIRILSELPATKPVAATAAAKPATTALRPPAARSDARPPVRASVAAATTAAADPGDARKKAPVESASQAVARSGSTVVAQVRANSPGEPQSMNERLATPVVDDAALQVPPPAPATQSTAVSVDDVVADVPDPGLAITRSVDPQFPMATMRRLRKGDVEVRFDVGNDGKVEVASVLQSTDPGLENAALAAVRQWEFKPTPKGHAAVVDLAFDLSYAAGRPVLTATDRNLEADSSIVMTQSAEPRFPMAVMRRLLKGKVVVSFEAGVDGAATNVGVVSSPDRGLDEAASEAVRQWRFAPMRQPRVGLAELTFSVEHGFVHPVLTISAHDLQQRPICVPGQAC